MRNTMVQSGGKDTSAQQN
uniref:Uncharacterized protein n=1 Tax=Anguilla anguilla TaxID=7936 RepID=A0A0E9SQ57_ANGAN